MNELARKLDLWLADYAAALIRWRWLVILASLLAVGLAGFGAQRLGFTNDYRVFFSDENPQLLAFDELQKIYTKNDVILFVITPPDGDVFTPAVLSAVKSTTERSWSLPYSIRVDSVTNFQHSRAVEDDLLVSDLVEEPASLTPGELRQLRDIALAEPLLIDRLISADAGVTAVAVTFQMPEKHMNEVPEAAAAARELAQQIRAEYPGIDLRLTGTVMLNNAFAESSMQDSSTLVPIMYGIILLAMILLLRSFAATLAALIIIIFSVITGMGLAGWLGIQLTPPSASAPTIITTLAVADAVHILVSMFAAMRRGLDRQAALIESLRLNMQPIFLTSITTAIGFLTMNFSDAPPFRDLGNITAMGVMAAWLFSVTTLPALISLLPIRARAQESRLAHSMQALADFVIARRRSVLVVGGIVAAIVMAAIPMNRLSDEFVKYFDDRVEFRRDSDYTVENLTGLYTVQFSLPAANGSGAIADPEYLADVEAFTVWLRTQPEVVHVNSITDTFKRLNQNMHGDDPSAYRLPRERDLAAQYLLLYEMSLPFGLDLNNQINVDKSATQVIATLTDLDSVAMRDIAARSEAWLQHNAPDMFTHAVSPAIMFAHISERNIKSMIGGTLLGILLISLIMIAALRSVSLGILSLVPNLLPAALAFGFWGLFVGQVNMAVSVVMGMTLGIVVDDSVHFLSKYLRARREHGYNATDAVRYAFSSVGVALVVTTVILVAGFAVLAQSSFAVNETMAKMTALAISLALIADFLLLPPLLIMLDARKQRTVPIDAQARNQQAFEL